MIAMVTGKLGSGKTYFCVNYILKKYYKYEDVILQYVPLSNIRIITNIRGFRLPHENLTELIGNEAGLPDMAKMRNVFNPDFVGGEKNVIFVIDEAQAIFPRKFYDVQIFTFFQKARQEGLDIFLITQDIFTLAREFQVLCEYEISALQRAKRSKNVFVYKYLLMSEGKPETFKTVSLKFRMDIASVYTSFVKTEKEKMSFVYKRYLMMAGIALVAAIIVLKFAIGTFFGFQGGKRVGKTYSAGPGGAVVVSEKDLMDERKKLFGKDAEKKFDKKDDVPVEKEGGKLEGNVEKTAASVLSEGGSNPGGSMQGQAPADRYEIGTHGPFTGRIVSIKYDDPLISGGSESSGGGLPGVGSSSPSDGGVDTGNSSSVVGGSGLAPSWHGYSGPWVWHPPSEWVTTDGRFDLVDYRGRVIGYIRGPEFRRPSK